MKELKFRAWDGEEMFHDVGVWGGMVVDGDCGSLWLWNEPALAIMQYTGLHDADGREIYEGDIFEAPHDFGPGGFAVRRASVAFHLERGYQWQYWLLDELRVIGNIHESPELLNND